MKRPSNLIDEPSRVAARSPRRRRATRRRIGVAAEDRASSAQGRVGFGRAHVESGHGEGQDTVGQRDGEAGVDLIREKLVGERRRAASASARRLEGSSSYRARGPVSPGSARWQIAGIRRRPGPGTRRERPSARGDGSRRRRPPAAAVDHLRRHLLLAMGGRRCMKMASGIGGGHQLRD